MSSRSAVRLARCLSWLSAALVAAACGGSAHEADPSRPRLVLLVVLDTIRSDHLSACGYARPTSPFLAELAARTRTWTCDAHAPGTWTLPSHASYFTGEEVQRHRADYADDGIELLWGVKVLPLDQQLPTLAEMMGARGYRTVALSANPVVSPETGLTRGFTTQRSAAHFGELYGERFVHALDEVLAEGAVEDAPSLFLFLNLADAHHPWPAIPEGVGWLPARPGLGFDLKEPGSPWRRYMGGSLAPAAARTLVEHHTDLYDFGVRRTDQTLARTFRLLGERGWLDGSYRIVVTSDHGEFLGQHGMVGHCCYPYDAIARVPLLYLTSASPPPELHGPVSAVEAFHLARDGRFAGLRPVAVGYPSPNLARYYDGVGDQLSVALWSGREKLLWIEGDTRRYELAEDPAEERPLPMDGHPRREELEALAHDARTEKDHVTADPALAERLRALGYVD